MTATDVHGANGAAVDNVRYYLLNPKLATGNNWGNPDWCSNGTLCTQSTTDGYITYDISESSNPANNYQIVWDKNTHSSGSTPYSRALTPANIPPGNYTLGLRIQDVNGIVAGSASNYSIIITNDPLGLKFSTTYFGLKLASGGKGLKALDMTSTGATKYWLYTPTNSLGIGFSPSEGNISPGQTIPIYVKAGAGQASGIYTGTVYATSSYTNGQSQTSTGVTDSITIEPGSYDTDKDGFTNDLENNIGTDPNYNCGVNNWPPDFNNDGKIDSTDQALQVQHTATYVGAPNYDKRYDLNFDGKINSTDQLIEAKQVGKTCTL